jgi:hypothetical protein
VWDAAAAAAACDNRVEPLNCATLHAAVLKKRDGIADLIAQRDGLVLAQIKPLLSDAQDARMYEVEHDRARSRVRFLPFTHFAARVDLVLLLDSQRYLDLLGEDARSWLMTSYGTTLNFSMATI